MRLRGSGGLELPLEGKESRGDWRASGRVNSTIGGPRVIFDKSKLLLF